MNLSSLIRWGTQKTLDPQATQALQREFDQVYANLSQALNAIEQLKTDVAALQKKVP